MTNHTRLQQRCAQAVGANAAPQTLTSTSQQTQPSPGLHPPAAASLGGSRPGQQHGDGAPAVAEGESPQTRPPARARDALLLRQRHRRSRRSAAVHPQGAAPAPWAGSSQRPGCAGRPPRSGRRKATPPRPRARARSPAVRGQLRAGAPRGSPATHVPRTRPPARQHTWHADGRPPPPGPPATPLGPPPAAARPPARPHAVSPPPPPAPPPTLGAPPRSTRRWCAAAPATRRASRSYPARVTSSRGGRC